MIQTLASVILTFTNTRKQFYFFDMCCSVHFCDNSKFCSQQMHIIGYTSIHPDCNKLQNVIPTHIKNTHTKYTIHLKLVLATDYYKDLYVWYNNNLKMFMYEIPR
jgi:hypothetical protein